jgi:predicted ATP-dependent endonuclease of OLD family
MLDRMAIKNLTVFPRLELEFARSLNVIVGENGTGKTHLLKIAYTALAVSSEERRKMTDSPTSPSKRALEVRLADKLVNVFRPEQLGHLVHHRHGYHPQDCGVSVHFDEKQMDIAFSFAAKAESEVDIGQLPTAWSETPPAYLPTRELMTIYPNFIAVYENHYLNFEETWRDTCVLLGALLQRGPKEEQIRNLLTPLEDAMGGLIELDKNGRFYLKAKDGRIEMPLVAEGLRKLGMLARLIATGIFLEKGYLFWDEPEANLNPKLVQQVARSILGLCAAGIQVFIATHSLFLLREFEILLASREFRALEANFMGLHHGQDGVSAKQGKTVDEIGDIAALDEVLRQSDRFVAER